MSEEEKVEPRIVEAVAVSGNVGGHNVSPLAGLIQHAMSMAVAKCYAEGIHDPEQVKEAMQAARAAIKHWYHQKMAEAAKELEERIAKGE